MIIAIKECAARERAWKQYLEIYERLKNVNGEDVPMIDKEKFFNNKKATRKPSKKMDEEDAVELAAPKHNLEVPGHHQALSQNQLLQEILSHRKALIQARAMAVDGTADSEGVQGGGESVPE